MMPKHLYTPYRARIIRLSDIRFRQLIPWRKC